MRVVYLNPCGQLGGAETSLLELLASLRTAAPDWELWLVIGEDGPIAEEARARHVNVVVAPFPPALARLGDSSNGRAAMLGSLVRSLLGTLRYRRSLGRILRSLRPDIIHSNGFKMHVMGVCARPRGTPLVWHIHDYVGGRQLMKHLLRMFHRACAVAIVNSKSVATDLRRLLPALRIVPIYNAVDLKRFSPKGSKLDLDALAGLPPPSPNVVRVGLVATFARWKGHKVFLGALAGLPTNTPVRGYIIGAPIYQTMGSQWSRRELEGEVERRGLVGRVGFTGFIQDTAEAMRSLDIVVHASTEPEPFGMVIIEAMACGKAVIAACAGGAAELFVDGENAIGHLPGDVSKLTEQMQRLISDGALRRRLGEAARHSSEREYGGQRLARELLAAYEQASDGAASGTRGFRLERQSEITQPASECANNDVLGERLRLKVRSSAP